MTSFNKFVFFPIQSAAVFISSGLYAWSVECDISRISGQLILPAPDIKE